MARVTLPVCVTAKVIDQKATAFEAMRLWKASGLTGGDIAKRMKIHRTVLSEMLSGHRDWSEILCKRFLGALQ